MSAEGRETLVAGRLFDVLDGVSTLMYVQDPEGRIVHANRAACELVGRPPAEVVGKLPAELFDPVTVERWSEQNREVLRTRRPIDVEDGWGGRTHLTHKTPVFDAEGKPVAVVGMSTDITDRKRAEDDLRRSETHLAEAQQIAGVGSWHWDTGEGELTWSTELCRLFGISPEDVPIGADALLLVAEEDRERVRESGRAALGGQAPMDLDVRIVRPDGEVRVLHCRAGVGLGPDGSPHRLDGTCIDVTDRRRAERSLAEAQRLAQLGSWDWDVVGEEISWSGEMYRIFGEEPEHFVPTREAVYARIVEEDRGPLEEQVMGAVDRGGDFDAFARIRRPDGQTRDVRFRGSMVRAAGAGDGRMHGICQDLTEVRRAEDARAEAVERFRTVFERAPIGIALLSRDGRFKLANEAMAEFLGRSGGALLDCSVADVTHPDDLASTVEALRRMVSGELAEFNGERRYVRPGGEVRWGAVRSLLLHEADGHAQHCLALVRDVTDQRLAERRRSALYGVSRILAGTAPLDEALPALVETIVRGLQWDRGALWLADAHGDLRPEVAWPAGSAPSEPPPLPPEPTASDTGIAIPLVSGDKTLGLLAVACDGTGHLGDDLSDFAGALGDHLGEFLVRKRVEERLVHQALHDPLTGLANRVLFFDRLDHAIQRLQREHAPLAVLFLDFDGFKAVNDRFGHAGGDEVLRRAADRVGAALRAEDTVARFGGDELVVLSEHVNGAAGGALIADRILEQLRTPIELEGEQVTLSASIGICVAPIEGADRDDLLHAADAAMYRAKSAGPGRYVISGV